MAEILNGGYSEFFDVMRLKDHPTLNFSEKVYVAILTRDLDMKSVGGDVVMRDKDLESRLRETVYHRGEKKKFEEIISGVGGKNGHSSELIIIPIAAPDQLTAAHPVGIATAGITADFVDRTLMSSGNCLEYSMTMAVIAKTFYEDEGIEVVPVVYRGQAGDPHFAFVWSTTKDREGKRFKLTDFGGGTEEYDRESLSKAHGKIPRATRAVVDWKGWGK